MWTRFGCVSGSVRLVRYDTTAGVAAFFSRSGIFVEFARAGEASAANRLGNVVEDRVARNFLELCPERDDGSPQLMTE
jgi:hypothetical protein